MLKTSYKQVSTPFKVGNQLYSPELAFENTYNTKIVLKLL